MKNPLIKRVPRELKSDWHKYLVIIVFMVLMIGVISGMYVGHDGMLESVYSNRKELNLEDGCFELQKKASPELLEGLAAGEKADVRQYFIDKGITEADDTVMGIRIGGERHVEDFAVEDHPRIAGGSPPLDTRTRSEDGVAAVTFDFETHFDQSPAPSCMMISG